MDIKELEGFAELMEHIGNELIQIRKTLEFGHGRPPVEHADFEKALQGKDEAQRLFILPVVAWTGTITVNIRDEIGRNGSSGFIVNVSDDEILTFELSPDGSTWAKPFELEPKEQIIFDRNYNIHSIRLVSADGEAKIWMR